MLDIKLKFVEFIFGIVFYFNFEGGFLFIYIVLFIELVCCLLKCGSCLMWIYIFSNFMRMLDYWGWGVVR